LEGWDQSDAPAAGEQREAEAVTVQPEEPVRALAAILRPLSLAYEEVDFDLESVKLGLRYQF
jgi:hypothetical protein